MPRRSTPRGRQVRHLVNVTPFFLEFVGETSGGNPYGDSLGDGRDGETAKTRWGRKGAALVASGLENCVLL